MNPIVIAAFPGLLFSIHPPTNNHTPATPKSTLVVQKQLEAPADSCSTYIYRPSINSTLYYNGKPISPEILNKLGPLAAPLVYGLSQENVG